MPKAYIVASINVTDPDGYEAYKNGAVKVTKEAGGTLLVSGGQTEAIEGTSSKASKRHARPQRRDAGSNPHETFTPPQQTVGPMFRGYFRTIQWSTSESMSSLPV